MSPDRWLIPEPFTLEPTESVSQEELDELAEVLGRVVEEAHDNPGIFAAAPHNSTAGAPVREGFRPAMTWQAFEALKDEAGA